MSSSWGNKIKEAATTVRSALAPLKSTHNVPPVSNNTKSSNPSQNQRRQTSVNAGTVRPKIKIPMAAEILHKRAMNKRSEGAAKGGMTRAVVASLPSHNSTTDQSLASQNIDTARIRNYAAQVAEDNASEDDNEPPTGIAVQLAFSNDDEHEVPRPQTSLPSSTHTQALPPPASTTQDIAKEIPDLNAQPQNQASNPTQVQTVDSNKQRGNNQSQTIATTQKKKANNGDKQVENPKKKTQKRGCCVHKV